MRVAGRASIVECQPRLVSRSRAGMPARGLGRAGRSTGIERPECVVGWGRPDAVPLSCGHHEEPAAGSLILCGSVDGRRSVAGRRDSNQLPPDWKSGALVEVSWVAGGGDGTRTPAYETGGHAAAPPRYAQLLLAIIITSGRRDSNSLPQDGILALCRVSYCRIRRRPDGTAAVLGLPRWWRTPAYWARGGFLLAGCVSAAASAVHARPSCHVWLERQEGLEPTSSAWKAEALPVELLPLLVAAELRAADPCGGDVLAVGLAFPVHCPDMCCPCGPRNAVSGCGSLLPAPACGGWWLLAGWPPGPASRGRCVGVQASSSYMATSSPAL